MKNLILILIIVAFISCKDKSDRVVIRNSGDAEILFYKNKGFTDSIASITFDKALDQIRNKEFKKAKKLLSKANEIEPDNKIILNGLGNVESDLKNFDKAYEYFEQALEVDNNFGITYLNYGTAFNKNSEEHKAIDILTKGVEIEKNETRKGYFYYTIADAYYDIKNYEKAYLYNTKALNIVTEPEVRKDLIELRDLIAERKK